MPLERKDRVKDQTQTTGTGSVVIDGLAPTGYRSIASAHTTGSSLRYTIINASGSEWEVGEGIWTSATNTLTRATVFASSNSGSLVNFTSGVKAVFIGVTAADAEQWDNAALVNAVNTFTTNQIISVNSSAAALRITQTGTGAALLVEDSANPDGTPFVINTDGRVGIGVVATSLVGDAGLQMHAESASGAAALYMRRAETSAGASALWFDKLRGTFASPTIVSSGDTLGNVIFRGWDGSGNVQGASIQAIVDGTPGTSDMPGRLVFSTTADGASSPTERMRITNAGNVLIGKSYTSNEKLGLGGTTSSYSSGTSAAGIYDDTTVSSAQSNAYTGVSTYISTQAAAFTLGNLTHYKAAQFTIGAGSAVTNQYGFFADGNLIGATNNYGFYSGIASGTGRWNFYANGTAENFFNGPLGIGSAAGSVYNFRIGGNFQANAFPYAVFVSPTVPNTATSAYYFSTSGNTAAAAFTVTDLVHYFAQQGTIGAGSAVISQFGFRANSNLTGATNNYGFYSDIPAATGRWNFYAGGTAKNIFAGQTSIGGLEGAESLRVTPVASAVNYIEAFGAFTGNRPVFRGSGSDTNIGLEYQSKAAGAHVFRTDFDKTQFVITHTASAANYVQITGAATGNAAGPLIVAQGTDANVPLALQSKLNSPINFFTSGGFKQLEVSPTASAVNYVQITGGATGNETSISATGSDADVNLAFRTKASGLFRFATNSGTNEQFRISPAAGAVNYWNMYGAATTGYPTLQVLGSDTNIGFVIAAKGTSPGVFRADSVQFTNVAAEAQLLVVSTPGAVNFLQLTGATTNGAIPISAQGADANIALSYITKGVSGHTFQTGGGTQVFISNASSAVNYLSLNGASTGNAPTVAALGSDANVDLRLSAKGTGSILLRTNSTQRFVIGGSGQLGIGATPSYGDVGQVLTSQGAGSAPTWSDPPAGFSNAKAYFFASF